MFKIKMIGLLIASFLVSACDEITWTEESTYEKLQGTWVSACTTTTTTDDSGSDNIEYVIETVTFDDLDQTVNTTNYETDSCLNETSSDEVTGTYIIGDTFTTDNGYEVNYIDSYFTLFSYDFEDQNIFLIEDDQLYMGLETDDGSIPTEIDGTYWLVKQDSL